jgi:hypothetical protein
MVFIGEKCMVIFKLPDEAILDALMAIENDGEEIDLESLPEEFRYGDYAVATWQIIAFLIKAIQELHVTPVLIGDLDCQDQDLLVDVAGLFRVGNGWNFKDDALGSNPAGWTITDEIGGTINVIVSKDGHAKVLELDRTSGDITCKVDFPTKGSTDGDTVELYIRAAQTNAQGFFTISDADTGVEVVQLYFHSDGHIYFRNRDPVEWTTYDCGTYTADTWYHLKIVGDFTNGTCDIYINDVKKVDAEEFSNNTGNDFGLLWCQALTSNGTYFVDAVGYSWDSGYTVGDNKLVESQRLWVYSARRLFNTAGKAVFEIGTSTDYPNEIYCYQLKNKVSATTFDAYNDIDLLRSLKPVEVDVSYDFTDPFTGERHVGTKKKKVLPKSILSIIDDEGFLNSGEAFALLRDTLLQMDDRLKQLESRQ